MNLLIDWLIDWLNTDFVLSENTSLTNELNIVYFPVLQQDLQRKHKELRQSCVSKPHNLQLVETQCQKELQVSELNKWNQVLCQCVIVIGPLL